MCREGCGLGNRGIEEGGFGLGGCFSRVVKPRFLFRIGATKLSRPLSCANCNPQRVDAGERRGLSNLHPIEHTHAFEQEP